VNLTTPADIKKQVQRLWDKGKLLSILVDGDALFPYRVALKTPHSTELSSEFDAIRQWIELLRKSEEKGYRIVWRELNHRLLGRNSLPKEIWIDSLDQAFIWIGKTKDAHAFKAIIDETKCRQPSLLPWLARQPLRALTHARIWTYLLDVVAWIQSHPLPGIYVRQIDVPGIHTKIIESFRGVLSELLDLALPPESIHSDAMGAANFCRRYGFRDKPLRIRLRILDPVQAIFPSEDQDITVTHETFSSLSLHKRRVFITENETNFLAFPKAENSLVIFGAGYGFEALAFAHWLHECEIHYWGDIDTHGFAILDQLRASIPHAHSLLMDRETLLGHRQYWITEPEPVKRDLRRLTDLENQLYNDLRFGSFGPSIRLEQEMINFTQVESALQQLQRAGRVHKNISIRDSIHCD
jgi:hypothetical protein